MVTLVGNCGKSSNGSEFRIDLFLCHVFCVFCLDLTDCECSLEII